METTLIIAIYGAVLSTIALLWNIIIRIRDRPKLVPKYSTGFLQWGHGLHPIFSITITNPTKYKIKLVSIEIHFKNGQKMILVDSGDNLPKEIFPLDNHTVYRDIQKIKQAIDEQGEPDYILVRDATDRKYKGSTQRMVSHVNALCNSI